ncbi:putative serine threonine protein kinase protein [Eutypa lata UCREL1]|uniref:Putative serine threonine protein kinase protein n=1 Tax=Eutypa lata (strain UCR-EL1) TaxID=1287681 RepID=M7T5Y5_EUTLA|nr:putative serine threonine protein kinase protein [Eutypa lata UCREL1]
MADRVITAKQGTDADALSLRDANVQILPQRPTDAAKVKAALASKVAQKEKDHPPPPPPMVYEPPSSDRKDGVTYQVGRMLGKGGFAVCYEGHIPGNKRKYALKVVKSKMPSKMEQKFQTELQIHSKMRHRNIVQFLRAFSFENSTYLVLELCPNGTLMDMVKRRKGLTEPEVRFYTVQIAGAIKYMHAKGIIHRDLKMGNIFLDRHMDIKIGDFGLAALLVTGKDMHTIRRTTLCGTPNYIAPEILEKGKKGHDHMVDIWSLGIIMFAMLTSKPPFQSSTTDEIYRRARNRDYEWPKPEGTNRYISQEAKDLVASMLVDADLRPEPDIIVQDDFFLSGYVPTAAEITSKLRDIPPDSDQFYTVDLTPQTASDNFRRLKELSEGIVYRPFDEVSKEQNILQGPLIPLAQSASNTEDEASTQQQAPTGLLRAPPQSFAAQQRAQNRPSRAANAFVRSQTVDDMPAPSASGTLRARASKLTTSVQDPVKQPQAPAPQELPSETKKLLTEKPREERATIPGPPEAPRGSLFSSAERKMAVPETQPDVVLERLQKLQTELERALNSRSMAIMGKTPTPSPPHIVVKWVDYSNKFGLGYILNDGSVGCVLKSIPGSAKGGKTVMLPPSCILVRDAEQHCSRRHDPGYLDRQQIVPMTQAIQFYENNAESGLSTVFVHPSQFKIEPSADGTPGKVPLGRDIYDYRKREHLILWKKFANYMMAYGRDQDATTDDTGLVQVPTTTKQVMPPNDVVTFYQRIGDVGCWVFADGHLQFNFPDHTKIVLDATGTWCHFWHLPQEAAEKLAETGELDETALDERAVLSYPLQTLLNFSSKPAAIRPTRNTTRKRPEINPMLQGIPVANDFRRKIEFIKGVVREWVINGGLGNSNMDRDRRLQWTGCRETVHSGPSKHVWVTIGARWGDERFSAVVDPKKPGELGGEVESKKG